MISFFSKTFVLSLCITWYVVVGTYLVEASTVVRTGESVTLNSEQVVEGDFYGVANVLSITGSVTEDAILVGGRVVLNGTVEHDVLITGGAVTVNATIGDDVRVVGGDVTISGPVAGDVVVVGGLLTVLSSATIGGDIVFYGGRLEMNGQVSGDIIGVMEQVRLDGGVAQNVDITTNSLTLGDRADITGVLTYVSANQLVRGQGAVVEGDVVRNDPPLPTEVVSWRVVLIPLLVILFSLLAWHLISPRTLRIIVDDAVALSLRSIFIGFGTFFFTPVLVGVLLASVVGSIVGMVVVLFYIGALIIAMIATGAVVGKLLSRYVPSINNHLVWSVAGTLVMYGAFFVPIIGPAAVLGLLILTLGTLTERIIKGLR